MNPLHWILWILLEDYFKMNIAEIKKEHAFQLSLVLFLGKQHHVVGVAVSWPVGYVLRKVVSALNGGRNWQGNTEYLCIDKDFLTFITVLCS